MQNLEWYLADLKSSGKNRIETVEKILTDMFIRLVRIYPRLSLFGADLYHHAHCMKQYICLYDIKFRDKSCESPLVNDKQLVWQIMLVKIEVDLNSGEGFELSVMRDSVNKKLAECCSSEQMNNREVEVLLQIHFGSRLAYWYSHKANKSILCFSSDSCSAQTLAETIQNSDHVNECVKKLRDCFLGYNFGLEDSFCDATALRDV